MGTEYLESVSPYPFSILKQQSICANNEIKLFFFENIISNRFFIKFPLKGNWTPYFLKLNI